MLPTVVFMKPFVRGGIPMAPWRRLTSGLLAGLLIAFSSAAQAGQPSTIPTAEVAARTLRVSLYPYIPAGKAAYFDLERAFQKRFPDVNLEIVLNDNYYDSTPGKGGIGEENADVYELDSVFMADFVRTGKIQPLEGDWSAVQAGWVPFAKAAASANGQLFGIAHWLCGNFLIYRSGDQALAKARSLGDIEAALKTPFPSRWLIADFAGRSTLGEMYLDGLMDRYKTVPAALAHIDPSTIDADVEKNMARSVALFRAGFGRDNDYHYRTGFYARQFGRGTGRAMVSYSEQLYYAIDEGMNDCRKDEACMSGNDIQVAEWPLADQGSTPIAWADVLVVDANVHDQKLTDAENFIRFMAEPDTFKLFLVPEEGSAPRYLLPARQDLYTDPAITKAAPLYPAFLKAISGATTVTAPELNRRLREVGKVLDGRLARP
jgi:thiamine pyridinylase